MQPPPQPRSSRAFGAFIWRSFCLAVQRMGWLWTGLGLVPVSVVTILGILGTLPGWLAVLLIAVAVFLVFAFGSFQIARRYKQQIRAEHLDEALIAEACELYRVITDAANTVTSADTDPSLTPAQVDKLADSIWLRLHSDRVWHLVDKLIIRGVLDGGHEDFAVPMGSEQMSLNAQRLLHAAQLLERQIGLRWVD